MIQPGVFVFICLAGIQLVTSYSSLRDRIPNGNAVYHPCDMSKLWDGVGHENSAGGGSLNPFGTDFKAHDLTWTVDLCLMDSDGDSKTNGEELGDPNCTWTIGAIPSGNATGHPGVCEPWDSAVCTDKNDFLDCESFNTGFDCPAIQHPDVSKIRVGFEPGTPVPAQETTYMCQGFALPTDNDYHLIAMEPDIDNINVAHHIIVYGCSEDATLTTSQTSQPFECFMGDTDGCQEIVAIWSIGIDGTCYPEEVGFSVGNTGFKYVIYEIHWNNPELVDDYTDASGVYLYLTTNKRTHDAGVLMIGQDMLMIPPMQEAFTVSGACNSDCTSEIMNGPINVVGTLNHMHNLGVGGLSEIIRPNSERVDLARDTVYDYNAPVFNMFEEHIQVNPGDVFNFTCVFNSRKKNTTTWWGIATADEMCYAFVMYYPKSNLKADDCVQHGIHDSCDWDSSNGDSAGCNPAYKNFTSPEMKEVISKLWTRCSIRACLQECLPVAREFHSNPCFVDDHRFSSLEYLPYMNEANRNWLTEFWYRADSCLLEITKEKWECDGDNGNGGSGDGSGGGDVNKATSGYFISLWALFICVGSILVMK